MATRFLVTVPFTRNGIAGSALFGVPLTIQSTAVGAINLATTVCEAYIQKIATDVVTFGTITSVIE